MSQKLLPKSLRKFLRREKARLRREFWGKEEAEKRIKELVEKIYQEGRKAHKVG